MSSVRLPHRDVEILRHSEIVKRIISTNFDGIAHSYVLRIRAELTNGWLLDCFEHEAPGLRRYSYHVFHRREMIVRWDNAPHHRGLKGFPHHKHDGEKVVESEEMTVEKLLLELNKLMNLAR